MTPILDIPDKTEELNRRFKAYLTDKSVAIVGRANLHELTQGEFIDSHDVVVRVHRAVPYEPTDDEPKDNVDADYNDPVLAGEFVPKEWHSRLGKRVDILYHRLRKGNRDYIRTWQQIFRAAGGKFVVCDCTSSQSSFSDAYPHEFLPVRYVSWELKSDITLKIRTMPDGGLVCITDILTHNIKSAYITGFPCFFDEEINPNLPHVKAKHLRFIPHQKNFSIWRIWARIRVSTMTSEC